MLSARLAFARDEGALALPVGRCCVFGARAGDDLSDLQQPVQIIQPMKPDHDALAARGYDVALTPVGAFASAMVVLPRSRDLGRDRIARAVDLIGDGPVWIDGQKTDGVDSMIRALKPLGHVDSITAKAHGKLFRLTGAGVSAWHAAPRHLDGGFVTRPGVFSADGIDRGSALLAQYLPTDMAGSAIDLGAGWGFLSHHILRRPGIGALHLVEADHTALACAQQTLTDPRARFHWADATTWSRDPVDHVVMNPPFHSIRAADPDLGRAFIARAAALLKPSGHLWLVANRHLPYEALLTEQFAQFTDLSDDPAFKVIHAERPRRMASRRA